MRPRRLEDSRPQSPQLITLSPFLSQVLAGQAACCLVRPLLKNVKVGGGLGAQTGTIAASFAFSDIRRNSCDSFSQLQQLETVQMTSQDTKKFFYLYEVPPSRVAKQGDRSSHLGAASNAWTMRISDVVDTGDIDGWFSKDFLKTCASFESVSELD